MTSAEKNSEPRGSLGRKMADGWEERAPQDKEEGSAASPGLAGDEGMEIEATDPIARLLAMMQVEARKREEEARRAREERAEMMAMFRAGLVAVKKEVCQYTDEQCGALRTELREMREEMQEEVNALKVEVASASAAAATSPFPPQASGDAISLPARWEAREMHARSRWPGDTPVSPPPTPPRGSPGGCIGSAPGPHDATNRWKPQQQYPPPSRGPTPPHCSSPQAAAYLNSPHVKRKPSEFDGKVAWEAYLAQFEMLAAAQAWSDGECAIQLVSSLRGQALEVLAHLTPVQRADYSCVVGALERRFGQHLQAEVYRARLRGRVRGAGEPLPRLAQDVETLVRRAYPAATEEMVTALSQDYFVDALRDPALQLYIKQAHPKGLREALSRGLEMEALTCTVSEERSGARPRVAARPATHRSPVYVRRTRAETRPQRGRMSPDVFSGECWGCGERGHRKSQCRKVRKARSAEDLHRPVFHPCCWRCGEMGHMAGNCPQPKDITTVQGNAPGLSQGAATQPSQPRGPRSM